MPKHEIRERNRSDAKPRQGRRRRLEGYLRSLTKEAAASASRLGHDLQHWRVYGGGASSHCRHCGAPVVCSVQAQPEHPRVFGRAVMLDCSGGPNSPPGQHPDHRRPHSAREVQGTQGP